MDEIWRAKIESELSRAFSARQRGNEGMARVCARRAAGWAAQYYALQKGTSSKTLSAYDSLLHLQTLDDIPPDLCPLLEHLVQRVEKGPQEGESYWPLDVDLIEDARAFAEQLLGVTFQAQVS